MTLAAQEQRASVDRLMSACGGSYSPEIRRSFFISGPQWAAAYRGQACQCLCGSNLGYVNRAACSFRGSGYR